MTINTPNTAPIEINSEIFRQQTPSPTLVAQCAMTEAPAAKTTKIGLERLETSLSHSIMYGSPASIAKQQNLNYTRVAYFQHSCTALSAGK